MRILGFGNFKRIKERPLRLGRCLVLDHQSKFALKSEQFSVIESLARLDGEIQRLFQGRHRFGKLASLQACFGQQSEEVRLEYNTTDCSNTADAADYLLDSFF